MKQWKNKSLTYHSAHFLVQFVLRVVSPQARQITLNTCQMLSMQLTCVANRLFNQSYNVHFHKDCELLVSFIENAPNYDRGAVTKALMNQLDSKYDYSRLYMLSLIFRSGKGCDAELQKYLIEMTEKHVFNDNNKDAHNYAILFEPFYKTIDEKTYMDSMHSNSQFCVNRSSLLLKNIAHLICHFSFEMSLATAEQMTSELVSKDQVFSHPEDVAMIYAACCDKVKDKEAFSKQVLAYLLGEFDKVKSQASVQSADKMKFLTLAAICIKLLGSDGLKCV